METFADNCWLKFQNWVLLSFRYSFHSLDWYYSDIQCNNNVRRVMSQYAQYFEIGVILIVLYRLQYLLSFNEPLPKISASNSFQTYNNHTFMRKCISESADSKWQYSFLNPQVFMPLRGMKICGFKNDYCQECMTIVIELLRKVQFQSFCTPSSRFGTENE